MQPNLLPTLASIAAFTDAEIDALASKWAQTDELADWDPPDVREILRDVDKAAETAVLERRR